MGYRQWISYRLLSYRIFGFLILILTVPDEGCSWNAFGLGLKTSVRFGNLEMMVRGRYDDMKVPCTRINLIYKYRILIQHATSMIWRYLKKGFFLLLPYLSIQWRIHTHEFCRLVTGSIDVGKTYGLLLPEILIHHLPFSYVSKKRSEEVVFPIFYHPHQGFDWLIDLCWTPT